MLGHAKCRAQMCFSWEEPKSNGYVLVWGCSQRLQAIGCWVLRVFFDFIELLICTHQTIVYDIASRMPGASPPSTDRKRTDSQIRPWTQELLTNTSTSNHSTSSQEFKGTVLWMICFQHSNVWKGCKHTLDHLRYMVEPCTTHWLQCNHLANHHGVGASFWQPKLEANQKTDFTGCLFIHPPSSGWVSTLSGSASNRPSASPHVAHGETTYPGKKKKTHVFHPHWDAATPESTNQRNSNISWTYCFAG